MFPQLKKLNNESGMILFIVLMTAIIIMIFCVGILSQSANEVNYVQQQIDQIESDQLAKGMLWNAYSSGSFSGSQSLPPLNGRVYGTDITNSSGSIFTSYNVVVNYDTF